MVVNILSSASGIHRLMLLAASFGLIPFLRPIKTMSAGIQKRQAIKAVNEALMIKTINRPLVLLFSAKPV